MPQVEVTFDIDANGIVHVTAKDKATGKEQKIKIEASSGISEDEIQRMVKEAEANSEADKKEKEKVEVKNQAESVVYSTEKLLKEHGDKISASDKDAVEAAVAELKKVQGGDDLDAIKNALKKVEETSHKLSEAMYKAAAESAQAQGAPGAGPQPGTQGGEAGPKAKAKGKDDSAVDADFEVVE
jgi:molecular chaperone DnaK